MMPEICQGASENCFSECGLCGLEAHKFVVPCSAEDLNYMENIKSYTWK